MDSIGQLREFSTIKSVAAKQGKPNFKLVEQKQFQMATPYQTMNDFLVVNGKHSKNSSFVFQDKQGNQDLWTLQHDQGLVLNQPHQERLSYQDTMAKLRMSQEIVCAENLKVGVSKAVIHQRSQSVCDQPTEGPTEGKPKTATEHSVIDSQRNMSLSYREETNRRNNVVENLEVFNFGNSTVPKLHKIEEKKRTQLRPSKAMTNLQFKDMSTFKTIDQGQHEAMKNSSLFSKSVHTNLRGAKLKHNMNKTTNKFMTIEVQKPYLETRFRTTTVSQQQNEDANQFGRLTKSMFAPKEGSKYELIEKLFARETDKLSDEETYEK